MKGILSRAPLCGFLIASICLIIFSNSIRGAAVPDTDFGNNGVVVTGVSSDEVISGMHFYTDGKFVLVLGGFNYGFAKFNQDGSPDLSFGNKGIIRGAATDAFIRTSALLPDGRIVVGGSAPAPDGNSPSDFFLARHLSNGDSDTSFGDGGYVYLNQSREDRINDIEFQPDGKIVAVGSHNDGGTFGVVLRFTSEGQIDQSFAGGGFSYHEIQSTGYTQSEAIFTSVAILSSGIISTGNASWENRPSIDDVHILRNIRLNSSGTVISDFSSSTYNVGCCAWASYASDGINSYRASSSYNSYSNNDGSGIPLQFDGETVTVLSNGDAVIRGGSGGLLKLYSKNGYKGRAVDGVFPDSTTGSGEVYATNDGKIMLVYPGPNEAINFQRILRITSQGTRNADFYLGDKAQPAVLTKDGEVRIKNENGSIRSTFVAPDSTVIPEYHFYNLNLPGGFYGGLFKYWNPGDSVSVPSKYFLSDVAEGFPSQQVQWGLPGDIAVGGDYDGDALSDDMLFRPIDGVWYSRAGGGAVKWGAFGDKPVPADYDYDGLTDRAVYRPATGEWWILKSSGGSLVVRFGIPTDIPITGDYDADGYADLTVYRPSEGNWYQLLSTEGFRVVRFGLPTDYPLSSDFDGDGRHDIAIYREGEWHILQSRDGYTVVNFGEPGDVPVTSRFDQ